jgi:hypothetical protein
LWDIVRHLPGTVLCPPREIDGIAKSLRRKIEEHLAQSRLDHESWDISRFERREQARQLALLLDEVCDCQAESEDILDSMEPSAEVISTELPAMAASTF